MPQGFGPQGPGKTSGSGERLKGATALCLALLALGGFAGMAAAQPANLPEGQAARQVSGARAAASGADEAAQLVPLGPNEDVPYSEVLAKPGDIATNFRFAQSEIRKGRLKAASATLERILLEHPDLVPVRLLYAIVLYRLDTDAEARHELETLKALPLPADARTTVQTYLDLIDKRARTTRFSANVSFGFQADTNRSSTPSGNRALYDDSDVAVDSARGDGAFLAGGNFRVDHDPGFQDRHNLFFQLSTFVDEQIDVKAQGFEFYSGELGIDLNLPFATVTPSMTIEHLRLQGAPYMLVYGPRLALDRRIDDQFDVFGQIEYRWQDYNNIFDTVDGAAIGETATERNGARFDAEIGVRWTISPAHSLTLALDAYDKNAEVAYEEMGGQKLSLSHTWLFGAGQFLMTAAEASLDRYNGPNETISARTRVDRTFVGRMTYGAPVSTIVPIDGLPSEFDRIVMTATAEGTRVLSNLASYDYANVRGQVLLSRRWEF